jgi:hypothetical protein
MKCNLIPRVKCNIATQKLIVYVDAFIINIKQLHLAMGYLLKS